MLKFLISLLLIGCLRSDAVRNVRNDGYSGNYADTGSGGFASSGTFTGNNGFDSFVNSGFGYAPHFGIGFIDPFSFHQKLTAQILAQHAAQNQAIASTFSSGNAFVSADASSYPDDIQIQQQIAQQQALFDAIRRQAQFNNGQNNNRYAPSFAAASGSVGSDGFYQSAAITPENPAVPNINNRFSDTSAPGGFKGVSVSSFSSTSDIDGKKTSHRGASTTINDNGKVTTYRVHS